MNISYRYQNLLSILISHSLFMNILNNTPHPHPISWFFNTSHFLSFVIVCSPLYTTATLFLFIKIIICYDFTNLWVGLILSITSVEVWGDRSLEMDLDRLGPGWGLDMTDTADLLEPPLVSRPSRNIWNTGQFYYRIHNKYNQYV